MSYGLDVRNSSGELVIDNGQPVYILDSEFTVTGTQYLSNSWFEFTRPGSNTLRFWKVPVGEGIAAFPNGFMGSKSTFTVRDIIRVPLSPSPSGYGMVVYNAGGNRVYQTTSEMVTIGDRYSVTTDGTLIGGTSVTVSDEWVAFDSWRYSLIPQTSFRGLNLSAGVYRDSSTTYTAYAPHFSDAPPGYTDLNPTSFITAK
jgi:hypothetical protein